MNILAIGAHFDDIELGCGGSLAKHVDKGDDVYLLTITNSGYKDTKGHEIRNSSKAYEEANIARNIIGAKEILCLNLETFHIEFNEKLNSSILDVIDEKKIDFIYTHWSGDVHHDHQVVAKSSIHCAKKVPNLLMYKSNWYQSGVTFESNYFVDITKYWSIKKKAIEAYSSENIRTDSHWLNFYHNEAINNGYIIGCHMAEAFVSVRTLI